MGKLFNLMLGIFVVIILSSGQVSASYYSNSNYGYENYYDSYNYGHSYGNSAPNIRNQPNLVSISSRDRYSDPFVYRSSSSSYKSYNSYYPGYSGERSYNREYVLDKYYPYFTYVNENSYRESSSPYSYNSHRESNQRLLSRPEHYLVMWSYR